MKRLFCIIGSLLICTSSVFAWNAESFLSDGSAEYQPYSLDPVEDPALDLAQTPMLMSLRDSSLLSSSDSQITVRNLANGFDPVQFGIVVSEETSLGLPLLSTRLTTVSSLSHTDVVSGFNGMNVSRQLAGTVTGPSSVEDVSSIYGPCFGSNGPDVPVFTLTLPLPVEHLNGASTIAFDSDLALSFRKVSGGSEYVSASGQLRVKINGVSVAELNPISFNNDFALYNLSSVSFSSNLPVTSLVLEYTPSAGGLIEFDVLANQSYALRFILNFTGDSLDSPIVSGLIAPPGLNSENNKVQGDLDIHHSIESEWTGSMTENFNALDLSGFTFPGGLVAAFALITGIFNDLWNGMGDYKILYVFPLTLGVVLLLIGRISKFSERSSSANSSSGRSSSGRGGKGGRSSSGRGGKGGRSA